MSRDSTDRANQGEPNATQPGQAATQADAMSPLPGEAGIPNITTPHREPLAKKGLLAVALLVGSLIVAGAAAVQRFTGGASKADAPGASLARDKPAAATAESRKLDLPTVAPSNAGSASAPRIPALTPTAEELVEPIGVRRSGTGSPAQAGQKSLHPDDAPVMLVGGRPGTMSTARHSTSPGTAPQAHENSAGLEDPDGPMSATSQNLRDYQRRLQGVLDGLTSSVAMASGQLGGSGRGSEGTLPPPTSAPSVMPGSAGLFGGQLQGSATPRVSAGMLGNRSLTLPKGTAFTCALKTKIVSAAAGLVGCEVQRNLYSDDGRVLLIERGSHLDGEYRVTALKPGSVRIPVLWTRIRTPLGVTADLESPGTGQLGESGIDGYVDKRWSERIGAALMLSLIDDSAKLLMQNQANERQADTIVLPSTTANTSKLAEKVLDSTINIPPLIYQNQGGIVGIYVARDIDFSTVYELLPTAAAQSPGRPSLQPRETAP